MRLELALDGGVPAASLEGDGTQIVVRPPGAGGARRYGADRAEALIASWRRRCGTRRAAVRVHGRATDDVGDAALALAASSAGFRFADPAGRALDVVLCHILPVERFGAAKASAYEHLDLVRATRIVSLLPREEIFLASPADTERRAIVNRHRRLLRRNRDLVVEVVDDLDVALADWRAFCRRRFDHAPAEAEVSALRAALADHGEVVEVRLGGRCIARQLIYLDAAERVLVDVAMAWAEDHAHRRLGYFTAVQSILRAADAGMLYCLGYGDYPYKAHLLSGLKRLPYFP